MSRLLALVYRASMSYAFTKVFSSLITSTVWFEPDTIRLVWITMMLVCDAQGRVWASVPGLAYQARVSEEDCEKALARFLAPDIKSRSQEYEGRRIEKIDGGWRLLNYGKYREMRDAFAAREYDRERKADSRKNPISPEAKKVIAELGFADRVLMRKIDTCLKAYSAATGKPAMETAEQMVRAYRAYETYAKEGRLRFHWAPRKFFEQGYWTSAAGWPIKSAPRQF